MGLGQKRVGDIMLPPPCWPHFHKSLSIGEFKIGSAGAEIYTMFNQFMFTYCRRQFARGMHKNLGSLTATNRSLETGVILRTSTVHN